DEGVHTLLDFHYRPHARAGNGRHGQGSNRAGMAGQPLELRVPDGTVVLDSDGEVLVDLTGAGTRFVAARGGRGGLGNAALASGRHKAPSFALLGEAGETRDPVLELRSVADVGLIGIPCAGKASLISVLSAARPEIAEYPFTTLAPNLGVVTAGDAVFTMADVPGLIPGASEGKGLGLDFLLHVERCSVLAHVIDCAAYEPTRDPISDIDALEDELAGYTTQLGGELSERPRIVILNKMDVPDAVEIAAMVRPELESRGLAVYEISTATHAGLRELSFALAEIVEHDRRHRTVADPSPPVLRPEPIGEETFTIEVDPDDPDGFVITGSKPERWVSQTNFDNEEAVGYLVDRLNRLGVEDELARHGAQPGAAVTIGEMTFDWEPSTPGAVAEHAAAAEEGRPTASQRKQA